MLDCFFLQTTNFANYFCKDFYKLFKVFSESGLYLTNVGKRGRQPGQLLRPIGISYSRNGYLLFTDYENKCINVFQGTVKQLLYAIYNSFSYSLSLL